MKAIQNLRSLLFTVAFTATTVVMSLFIIPGLLLPYRFVLSYKQLWLRVVLWQIRIVIGIDFEFRLYTTFLHGVGEVEHVAPVIH